MKLRNKQSGEIKEFVLFDGKEMQAGLTLENLAQDWEDYEEPKEYWFINDLDGKPMKCELRYCPVRDFDEWSEKRKKIGNYFSSREEAELTVRKLKAWKRLKDNGFKFRRWEIIDGTINFMILPKGDYREKVYEDLDICFGGEE